MILLDCTLRDGGYYNAWDFQPAMAQSYLAAMQAAGVDVVELGFRSLKTNGFKGAFAYSTDEFLYSLNIPPGMKVCVMVNACELVSPDLSLENLSTLFPCGADDSPVGLVRIACHAHEFEKVLPASRWLQEHGYRVGFNLMQVADKTHNEIIQLVQQANDFPIDVLYVADSLGSMSPDETRNLVESVRDGWQGAIGIHTHDNQGLALQNSLAAAEAGATWIDATVTGMGRGPGNAKMEELLIAIADELPEQPNLIPLLALIRRHFQPMKEHYGWGTNPYYYLAGKYGIHPTYIQSMLTDSRYTEEDLLAVIDRLRVEGGKKFSLDTLDAARHFYKTETMGEQHHYWPSRRRATDSPSSPSIHSEASMRSVVLIPARYASSRYPGKPLVNLIDKPMIIWVAELSARAVGPENVYVATDDDRIAEVAKAAGFQIVMTSPEALTGTDRLAEAAEQIDADIFINVQGDEPLVMPEDILRVRDAKLADMDSVINGFSWVSGQEDVHSVNIPKVITTEDNQLIYMSRLALPGFKDPENAPQAYKKQVCIYGFSKPQLAAFRRFGRKSLLEKSEDIEILRFLELGVPIKMIETRPGSLAVDVPEDVPGVEAALRKRFS